MFQFQKVQLKGLLEWAQSKTVYVSIPKGAVKSLPYFLSLQIETLFQFQKVQLKAHLQSLSVIGFRMFQFQKVQLKG